MSGIALVGGTLLILAILIVPVVLVCKMLGAGMHVGATLVVAQASGSLVRANATQQRIHARALEAQRAAARA